MRADCSSPSCPAWVASWERLASRCVTQHAGLDGPPSDPTEFFLCSLQKSQDGAAWRSRRMNRSTVLSNAGNPNDRPAFIQLLNSHMITEFICLPQLTMSLYCHLQFGGGGRGLMGKEEEQPQIGPEGSNVLSLNYANTFLLVFLMGTLLVLFVHGF